MTVDERFVEIEIRAAHLEKLVSELSDVVYRQQQELDLLRAMTQQLRDKMAGDPGLVDAGGTDKPPHY